MVRVWRLTSAGVTPQSTLALSSPSGAAVTMVQFSPQRTCNDVSDACEHFLAFTAGTSTYVTQVSALLEPGDLVARDNGAWNVTAISLSPDSVWLAIADSVGVVRLWST